MLTLSKKYESTPEMQYVIDTLNSHTTILERIDKRMDAYDSDIIDIDKEIDAIQTEMKVNEAKKKLLITIGASVGSVFGVLFSWLLNKFGAR